MLRYLLTTLLLTLASSGMASAQWGWHGTDGDDILLPERTHDDYWGNAGDDILLGGQGDDYLHGGDGSDVMIDNSGSDVFKAQDGFCDVIDSRDDGTDPWFDTIDADECDIIYCDWNDLLEVRNEKGEIVFEGFGFEYWEWLGGDQDANS